MLIPFGIVASSTPGLPTITGGTLFSDATYFYRRFTGSGTFLVTNPTTTPFIADVLIVAGGGPAGVNGGGGGGAGGVVQLSNQAISGSNTVTIGAGGAWQGTATDSSFGSLGTALKGGWGRSRDNPPTFTQTNVGSGGGGAGYQSGAGNNQGIGTVGQGRDGGPGTDYGLGGNAAGGGGGGFSEVGISGAFNQGGRGGNGINTYSSWGAATSSGHDVSGVRWFAGGGGAGVTVSGNQGAAGNGSVGANTGGGGNNTSGNSGIVLVRYLRTAALNG
jgi:hypothetical protein